MSSPIDSVIAEEFQKTQLGMELTVAVADSCAAIAALRNVEFLHHSVE